MYDLVPTMPMLKAMPENFSPFYVFTAVRRFMFFLDPKHTGRIPISVLIRSRVMDELLQLGMQTGTNASSDDASDKPDEQVQNDDFSGNWFSAENALRVYSEYLELDTDQNGMLSRDELLAYSGSKQPMRLTKAFVWRIFEEIPTYRVASPPGSTDNVNNTSSINNSDPEATVDGSDTAHLNADHVDLTAGSTANTAAVRKGEMDYKTFLDFVLAMENKHTPQALRYFWRLLDVQRRGKLGRFAINYFFRDVVTKLRENGFEPPDAADVRDEIFELLDLDQCM